MLDARPTVENDGRIELGARFFLASSPVQSHLVTGEHGLLTVGDDVSIGHGAAIAAFERVEIGSGARVGPLVIIMDTDFHKIGDANTSHQTTPVRIGRGARIGARVTLLRGADVGDGAVVEAGAVVSGKVGAGQRVAGVPARAVRAAGTAVEADVPQVVMHALGLAAPPPSGQTRQETPGWDSLGALKVLLALEDAFGVSLPEEDVAKAVTVAHLESAVERARARSTPR
jgi:acetyltransferase-like isoleucine patch superfamily enzyme/acyl carrier protein